MLSIWFAKETQCRDGILIERDTEVNASRVEPQKFRQIELSRCTTLLSTKYVANMLLDIAMLFSDL